MKFNILHLFERRKKEILEWNGDPNDLPPAKTQFSHNGKVYTWRPCNCKPSCQRPNVYTRRGKRDEGMTILARGNNQGHLVLNVLIKAGHSAAELAKLDWDPEQLVMKIIDDAEESGQPLTFLVSKNLSIREINAALGVARGLPKELAVLLASI